MKRFYRDAAAVAAAQGFIVHLDGKPVRTPAKNELRVPNRTLAEAIAAEWDNQGEDIKPLTLPLTRLVSTGIDRVASRRPEIVKEIANYASTDLLCYRATEPAELVARQDRNWQPLLDWAMERFDAPLCRTQGVTPVTQLPAALTAIERAVATHSDLLLVALHLATSSCGSVVIALALLDGKLNADEAFEVAQLDESFQIERWGEDSEQTKQRAGLKEDIASAARFAALLRAD
jgi:chaperone required for assembly of F1-ATPase